MIYYFDSNIFITAQRHDFPLQKSPEFWDWLIELGTDGIIKIPEVVFDEIGDGDDDLAQWLSMHKHIFKEHTVNALPGLQKVLDTYENPMQAKTLDIIQCDALVIAHALTNKEESTVVTYEVPTNAIAAYKKKIPSICSLLNIPCIRFPQFIWHMSNLGAKKL